MPLGQNTPILLRKGGRGNMLKYKKKTCIIEESLVYYLYECMVKNNSGIPGVMRTKFGTYMT